MASESLLAQLKAEKDNLDPSFVHCNRMITEEIERIERGFKYTELHNEKRKKLVEKVIIPVKDIPKVNFVGKLLGPQGSTLKGLQAETGCKIAILGTGSIKDKKKEEDLRTSGDAKYQHLNEELHVLIECVANPMEAHSRMVHALTEVQKYLHPDYLEELQDGSMGFANGAGAPRGGMRGRGGPPMRGRGGAGAPNIMQSPVGRGAPRGVPRGGLPSRGAMRGGPTRGGPPARGTPRGRGAPMGRGASRPVAKADDPYAAAAAPTYENEYYSTGSTYETPTRAAPTYGEYAETDSHYYDYSATGGAGGESGGAAYESYESTDYQQRANSFKAPATRGTRGTYRTRPY